MRVCGPTARLTIRASRASLVLARLLLARTHAGPALVLLDRLASRRRGQRRDGSLIEILALRALALAAAGVDGGRVTVLAAALRLRRPAGIRPGLRRRRPGMAAVLTRLSRPSAATGRRPRCPSPTWPGCRVRSAPAGGSTWPTRRPALSS